MYDTWAKIAGGTVMNLFEATGTANLGESSIGQADHVSQLMGWLT